MKIKRIKFCKICGKECDKLFDGMCKKHYLQMKTYGKIINANQRTVFDPNELRVYNNYAEIDTYDSFGGVFKTYKIDLDDIPKLGKCKWRTIVKIRNGVESYYLGTGHTIYFHRLIMGNPNCEIDHLNRNTLDNRRENLRVVDFSINATNAKARIESKTNIRGVYFRKARPGIAKASWICEWSDKEGRHSRSFSIEKYGEEQAFELACSLREEKMKEMKI